MEGEGEGPVPMRFDRGAQEGGVPREACTAVLYLWTQTDWWWINGSDSAHPSFGVGHI